MLEGDLPIFVARYCATDGMQANRQLFDCRTAYVVERAAWYRSNCSNTSDLEPVHLLVALLRDRDQSIASKSDRKTIINMLHVSTGYENTPRWGYDWAQDQIWINDDTTRLVHQASELANQRELEKIGRKELFTATVSTLSSQIKYSILETGVNLDEIVLNASLVIH